MPKKKNPLGSSQPNDDCRTPAWFVRECERRWAPVGFRLDPCATTESSKGEFYFTREDNGLRWPWRGAVFCNPPWSDIGPWVEKAIHEVGAGNASVVVMLLPSRTDRPWYKRLEASVDLEAKQHIAFRLNFEMPDEKAKSNPIPVTVFVLRKPIQKPKEAPRVSRRFVEVGGEGRRSGKGDGAASPSDLGTRAGAGDLGGSGGSAGG